MGARITIAIWLLNLALYGLSLLGKYHWVALPECMVNYLADLLTLPIILPVTYWLIRLIPRHRNFSFTWIQLVAILAYFGIVFEWLLPQMNGKFTRDPIDLIAYLVGLAAYCTLYRDHWIVPKLSTRATEKE